MGGGGGGGLFSGGLIIFSLGGGGELLSKFYGILTSQVMREAMTKIGAEVSMIFTGLKMYLAPRGVGEVTWHDVM